MPRILHSINSTNLVLIFDCNCFLDNFQLPFSRQCLPLLVVLTHQTTPTHLQTHRQTLRVTSLFWTLHTGKFMHTVTENNTERHLSHNVHICIIHHHCMYHYMVFTMRLHVMQCTELLSQFCLSVRPSIRCMYCDKTKWCTADILTPHKGQSF